MILTLIQSIPSAYFDQKQCLDLVDDVVDDVVDDQYPKNTNQ